MVDAVDLENELQMLQGRLKQTQDKADVWMKDEIKQLVANQSHKHEKILRDMNGKPSVKFSRFEMKKIQVYYNNAT